MEQFSEFFENLAFMTFSHDRFWVLCAIIIAVILVYQLLRNTLLLFCLIPLCLLLGLGLALIMDQGLRGTALFRTLILLPFALSFVVTGTVWAYMYRPTGGVLNSFLSILGVDVSAAMKAGHLIYAAHLLQAHHSAA